jgi:hypothetical protein
MAKTILVERDIGDGRELIKALGRAGFRVRAALWFYLSESAEWRLLVATPLVDEEGPIKAYTRVQSVLDKLSSAVIIGAQAPTFDLPAFGITLQDISVVSPRHELIRALRSASRKGTGASDMRITRGVVDNVFIDDVYIYRVR